MPEIIYLTHDFEPTTKAQAELIKVIRDDGKIIFAKPSHQEVKAASQSEAARLLQKSLPRSRALYREARRKRKTKQINTEGLPPALAWLLEAMGQQVENIMSDLAEGALTAAEWAEKVAAQIAEYYGAAFMAGQTSELITEEELDKLAKRIQVQLKYLDQFQVEIADAAEFIPGWNARAEMYANGIKTPYWDGVTKILPLPAMPGEGTQCLTNCRCQWRIDVLDEDGGDYDAYWDWEEEAEHCQTCIERHRQWSPLRIRKGRLL